MDSEILEFQELLRKKTFNIDLKKDFSASGKDVDSLDEEKIISKATDYFAKNCSNSIVNMSDMVVSKPYYPSCKEELLKTWKNKFSKLCEFVEPDKREKLASIILQSKDEGWNGRQLEKIIRNELPAEYAEHTANIARTGSSMLNSAISLESYKEIGVNYYVWMAAMDERTRPEHAMMNGLICSVTDSTVWYEENPDDPMHPIEHKRDDSMAKSHPGEEPLCRCTMVAWDPEIDGKYEIKK